MPARPCIPARSYGSRLQGISTRDRCGNQRRDPIASSGKAKGGRQTAQKNGVAPKASGAITLRLCPLPSPAGTDDLYFQIPDFLAQRVAIDAQQIGGADLVAAGGGKRGREERIFDLPQDAMIEAGRRQAVADAAEIFVEITLDRGRQVLLGAAFLADRRWRRRRQLVVNDGGGDGLLRIKGGEAAREIFEFAHIAGPAVALEPLYGDSFDLL